MICSSSHHTGMFAWAHSHPGWAPKLQRSRWLGFSETNCPHPRKPHFDFISTPSSFSESPWLCHATERTLLGSNRDTFSMHLGYPSFMSGLWFAVPTSSTKLLEAYMWDCLTQVPLLLCSFIGFPAHCPKPSLFVFFFFLFWSQWALLVCCTTSVPLGSAMHLVCVGGGERSSALRLIKFDNTQQIGSWVRGNFSHAVSLSCFSGGPDLCSIPDTLLSTRWVILACYFTSLYSPVSSQPLCGASFCLIEGMLWAPGSSLRV